jgi:Zn-dependent protease
LPLSDLANLIPVLLLLILSLSVHEAAHAWTADRLGDPTARALGRVTLNPLAHIDWIGTVLFPVIAFTTGAPLIGWAKPVPVNFHNLRAPRRDFAIIAAAGPASNLAQAVLGAAVLALAFDPLSMDLVPVVLRSFVSLNVALAVFNMIPVPPLDGGNVLSGILPEQFARLIDQIRPWGFLVLYALLFTGVLRNVVFPIAGRLYDLLVPVY